LFLCLFFRSFFLRLCVAIFRSFRFLPQGTSSSPCGEDKSGKSRAGTKRKTDPSGRGSTGYDSMKQGGKKVK
jgi:hypothetical protein